MQDKINKCLLLLALDESVLERHKEKVEQIFRDVNLEEIVDVLTGIAHNRDINYKALRITIPQMLQNLKKLDENISAEKINSVRERWRMKRKEGRSEDYVNISRTLFDADIDHVYVTSPSFYQRAYPRSFVEKVFCNVNVLVRENAIDAAYALLMDSLGVTPMCEKREILNFIKEYSSGCVPLLKDDVVYTMSHKLSSPRMYFCKINANVQEVFSRAVIEQRVGGRAKILSAEDQILSCFAQMYYQQMYENRYTPQHYADIVGYVYNNKVDWARVRNYSNRYDSNRILFYCILFLNEVHYYLFAEDLFEQSLLNAIPTGMVRHLYECRNGALFTDDIVGYHDSEPHELLLGFRHVTASFGDLSSQYHPMEKEEKIKFLDKLEAHGICNYDYDAYGDISRIKDED